MDCSSAQQIVCAAFDREVADLRELEIAEDHCRSCPACAAFLSGLEAIRRLPQPEAPEDLLRRTIEAVRREAVATDRPEMEEPIEEQDSKVRPVEQNEPATGVPPAVRPRWQGLAPWAAAAAVLLVAVGVITAQGVRFLSSGEQSALPFVGDPALDSTKEDVAGMPESLDAPPAASSELEDGVEAEATRSPGAEPSYVVFGQTVYRLTGMLTDPPTGPRTGSLTSALDEEGAPVSREVFGVPSSDAIVIAGEGDGYLRFEPVTRTLRGHTYQLRSSAIDAFGDWPRLPSGVPEPASQNGSPAFIRSGTDDAGVRIYVRPGTDESAGFAVAPGTEPSDPAAANPGWTWWEPRR